MSVDSHLGMVLAGYRIEALLGRGGMGVVYQAEHTALGRKAALKILSPDLAADATFRRRFIRESQLAASIEHPNIIPIYDAAEAHGELFIAMRYVEGSDLATVIRTGGPLDIDHAVSILTQVGDALDAAHEEGLVHRDVKPANILIGSGRRGEEVFLTDFGVTKRGTSESHLTSSGQLLGTVDYMAPEQIQGKAVDWRADLYALGCVAFEALTGQKPFERDSEVAVVWAQMTSDAPAVSDRREVPPGVDRAVKRAMAKAPEDRFQTSREFVEALRKEFGLETEIVSTPTRRKRRRARPPLPRPSGVGRTLRRVRHLSWRSRAIAAALAVAVAAGVFVAVKPSARSVDLASLGNVLAALDPAGGSVKSAVRVGDSPSAVAVSVNAVWVANRGAGTIDRFDPQTGQTSQVGTAANPTAVAIGDGFAWVLGGFPKSSVTPFGLSNGTKGRSIDLGTQAEDIAFGAGSVWVTDLTHRALLRIDATSHQPTSIEVGGIPTGVAAGKDSAWVTVDAGSKQVLLRLDPDGGNPRRFDLPARANSVTLADDDVWVTEGDEGAVLRVDATSGRVARTFRVGRDPVDMAVGDGAVWVANFEGMSVSRIDTRTAAVQTTALGLFPTSVAVGDGLVWVSANRNVHKLQKAICTNEIPVNDPVTCWTLAVPERHTDPGGRSISLWVERVRTGLGASPAPDPVLVVGQDLGEHADYPSVQPLPARTNRETIVLDTRGVGLSTPKLDCPEVEALPRSWFALRLSDPAARREFLDAVRTCHDRLVGEGIDLGAYNITEAAQDVDDLRRALAIPTWNLRSLGWASRVVFEVMRNDPQGVRAVWMDSPQYPQDDYFGDAPGRAREAIDALSSTCADDPPCHQRYPDVSGTFERAVIALNAHPVTVTLRDPAITGGKPLDVVIDGDMLARAVRHDISGGAGQPLMPARIYAAAQGRLGSGVDSLAASLLVRLKLCNGYRGHCARPIDFSGGAGYSMLCHDEAPYTDRSALAGLPPGFAEDYGRNPYLDLCPIWNVDAANPATHAAVTSSIPILIFHGVFDGYAPPSSANDGSRGLSRSFVYTVPGGGWNILSGDPCPLGIRNAWINDPTVEPDVSCLAAMPKVIGGHFNFNVRSY